MPNYIRWREEGASYFFTVVTYRRRPLFGNADARHLLNRAFVHARRTKPFDMIACVLLPDHLHCIWSLPEGDDGFPARWASIKRFFTHHYLAGGGTELPVTESRNRQRGRGVWQPRYREHRIRDELAEPACWLGRGRVCTDTFDSGGWTRRGRGQRRSKCPTCRASDRSKLAAGNSLPYMAG